MSLTSNEVCQLLRQLIEKHKALNDILLNDQALFKDNDLQGITTSNTQKELLNQAFLSTIDELISQPPLSQFSGNLTERLQAYQESLSTGSAQQVLTGLLTDIRDIWSEGHRLIRTNQVIVDANIGAIRELFAELTHQVPSQASDTYNSQGSIR